MNGSSRRSLLVAALFATTLFQVVAAQDSVGFARFNIHLQQPGQTCSEGEYFGKMRLDFQDGTNKPREIDWYGDEHLGRDSMFQEAYLAAQRTDRELCFVLYHEDEGYLTVTEPFEGRAENVYRDMRFQFFLDGTVTYEPLTAWCPEDENGKPSHGHTMDQPVPSGYRQRGPVTFSCEDVLVPEPNNPEPEPEPSQEEEPEAQSPNGCCFGNSCAAEPMSAERCAASGGRPTDWPCDGACNRQQENKEPPPPPPPADPPPADPPPTDIPHAVGGCCDANGGCFVAIADDCLAIEPDVLAGFNEFFPEGCPIVCPGDPGRCTETNQAGKEFCTNTVGRVCQQRGGRFEPGEICPRPCDEFAGSWINEGRLIELDRFGTANSVNEHGPLRRGAWHCAKGENPQVEIHWAGDAAPTIYDTGKDGPQRYLTVAGNRNICRALEKGDEGYPGYVSCCDTLEDGSRWLSSEGDVSNRRGNCASHGIQFKEGANRPTSIDESQPRVCRALREGDKYYPSYVHCCDTEGDKSIWKSEDGSESEHLRRCAAWGIQ